MWKETWGQCQAGKVGRVWWSSVDCLKGCKSTGYEKEQYLGDYHRRLAYAKCLHQIGAKIAEW